MYSIGRNNCLSRSKSNVSAESKKQQDLNYLRTVFPGADYEDLVRSLDDANGDRQAAVDIQLDKSMWIKICRFKLVFC